MRDPLANDPAVQHFHLMIQNPNDNQSVYEKNETLIIDIGHKLKINKQHYNIGYMLPAVFAIRMLSAILLSKSSPLWRQKSQEEPAAAGDTNWALHMARQRHPSVADCVQLQENG